jgi:hypothetical protein
LKSQSLSMEAYIYMAVTVTAARHIQRVTICTIYFCLIYSVCSKKQRRNGTFCMY